MVINKQNKNMKTKTNKRVVKLKVKSFTEKPHTNFANEISSDKFLDRTFYTTVSIVAILGIILLIVNLTR
jgi:hypothetical protein